MIRLMELKPEYVVGSPDIVFDVPEGWKVRSVYCNGLKMKQGSGVGQFRSDGKCVYLRYLIEGHSVVAELDDSEVDECLPLPDIGKTFRRLGEAIANNPDAFSKLLRGA